jgi:hypothetical protein
MLTGEIIKNKISLDAALLYKSILFFEPSLREDLLEMQCRGWARGRWLRRFFDGINWLIDRSFKKDLAQFLKESTTAISAIRLEPKTNETRASDSASGL